MNSPTRQTSEDRLLLIPRARRRKFVVRYVCLTLLGLVVGLIVSTPIVLILQPVVATVSRTKEGYGVLLATLFGVMFGISLSTAQWVELRKHLESSQLWILASSIGFSICSGLLFSLAYIKVDSQFSLPYLFAPIVGNSILSISWVLITIWFLINNTAVGIAQWFVLRQSLQSSSWWIILPSLTSVAFYLLSLLIFAIASLFPSLTAFYTLFFLRFSGGIDYVGSINVLHGIIQAISLCFCQRRRLSR